MRKHFRAAADAHGDTAHLGPAFATYHRAFTLRFENALLAVQEGALESLKSPKQPELQLVAKPETRSS